MKKIILLILCFFITSAKPKSNKAIQKQDVINNPDKFVLIEIKNGFSTFIEMETRINEKRPSEEINYTEKDEKIYLTESNHPMSLWPETETKYPHNFHWKMGMNGGCFELSESQYQEALDKGNEFNKLSSEEKNKILKPLQDTFQKEVKKPWAGFAGLGQHTRIKWLLGVSKHFKNKTNELSNTEVFLLFICQKQSEFFQNQNN